MKTDSSPTSPLLENSTPFTKKVYSAHFSNPLSDSIKSQSIASFKGRESHTDKKIRPTEAVAGLREEFKKAFLPLFVDMFELKQKIERYKSSQSPFVTEEQRSTQTPQEIIRRLNHLKDDIEESKKWCEGMVLEVSKAIEEATTALGELNIDAQREVQESKQPPIKAKAWQKIRGLFRGTNNS
ncbi:MAG: hypothetical protein S4CHLAM102_15380 [Chlamydiia bacterium]|nr:hypothetical protein [Chlamydiia bacterium]